MPHYTKDDMRRLAQISVEGSIPNAYLPEFDYDSDKFKEFLNSRGLEDDARFLFDMEFEDIVPLIDDESKIGYLKFRMEVGK